MILYVFANKLSSASWKKSMQTKDTEQTTRGQINVFLFPTKINVTDITSYVTIYQDIYWLYLQSSNGNEYHGDSDSADGIASHPSTSLLTLQFFHQRWRGVFFFSRKGIVEKLINSFVLVNGFSPGKN